jgi:hypothetical protein
MALRGAAASRRVILVPSKRLLGNQQTVGRLLAVSHHSTGTSPVVTGDEQGPQDFANQENDVAFDF